MDAKLPFAQAHFGVGWHSLRIIISRQWLIPGFVAPEVGKWDDTSCISLAAPQSGQPVPAFNSTLSFASNQGTKKHVSTFYNYTHVLSCHIYSHQYRLRLYASIRMAEKF